MKNTFVLFRVIRFLVASVFISVNFSNTNAQCNPPVITQNPVNVFACQGNSVSFTVAATGTNCIYKWYSGTNPLSDFSNYSGTSTPTFTISNNTGNNDNIHFSCQVTACGVTATSNWATVTTGRVFSPPIYINGPSIVCPGQLATYTATVTNYWYTNNFQWKVNGISVGTNSSSFSSAALNNGDLITCVLTSNDPCTPQPGYSAPFTVTLTSGAPPSTPVLSGPTSGVCSSVKTYSASQVASATSYVWTAPPGAVVTSGQGTTSASITFPSTFSSGQVSVSAQNFCGPGLPAALVVSGAPAQPGAISGPASVCHNQNNVTFSVSAVSSASSYTWTVPAGCQIKSGQGTNIIRVRFGNSPGSISVKGNNSCGSGPSRMIPIAMPCRNADEKEIPKFDVSVFPNPSSAQFTFNVEVAESNYFNIIIVDITGRIIEFHEHVPAATPFSCGENLSGGIYIAEIISGNDRRVMKLLKK